MLFKLQGKFYAIIFVPSVSDRRIFSKSRAKRCDLFSYSLHIGSSQVGEGHVVKACERFARVQGEDLYTYLFQYRREKKDPRFNFNVIY